MSAHKFGWQDLISHQTLLLYGVIVLFYFQYSIALISTKMWSQNARQRTLLLQLLKNDRTNLNHILATKVLSEQPVHLPKTNVFSCDGTRILKQLSL